MKDGSSKQRGKQKQTRKQYAIEHYVELRSKKSSVEEIAKACNVTTAFIYRYVIPEVSRITGISKDDLLYQPHSKPVYTTKPGRKPKATTNAEFATEPAVEAQEEATETAPAEEVAPTFDDAVKEAANVQTESYEESVGDTHEGDITSEGAEPKDGVEATELETSNQEEESSNDVFNPILKRILDNVGAVRQIIQEMCN